MEIRLTVRDCDGLSRDVAVSAPAGTALQEVSEAVVAATLPRGSDRAAELWSGTRRLRPDALLGGPGLRSGDIVHLDSAGERDLAAGAVLRLQVVGGPDAGAIWPLPRGVLTVGRDPSCDARLTDPDVSRRHAAITVTTVGIVVRDLSSTNGTVLDGARVDPDGSPLRPGQLLRLGDSLLCVACADEPAAATRLTAGGTRLVNRPPRLSTSLPEREVTMPGRSSFGGSPRVQWLAALLPALAGLGLAVALHNLEFLAFTLLSPVVIIGTALGDRLHWRRSHRREAIGMRRRDALATRERAELLAAEIAYRRRAHPDPASLLRTATIPDSRLWERRRRDRDLLDVRLGLADQAALLRIRRDNEITSAGVAPLVPLAVNLRAGPLGFAGPRGVVLGSARWIVAQLATLHSPADLQIALLLSDGSAQAWTWARWLPHLERRPACTPESRAALVAELTRLIDDRLAATQLDPHGWPGSWLVVVIDRCGEVADLPSLGRVLAAGAAVGITAVCLDDQERRLPTACRAVARVSGETGTRLAVEVADSTCREAVNDRVSARWAERLARGLASLGDAGAADASALPGSCRLLDLLCPDHPAPETLAARWRDGARPSTPLGIAADRTFTVDLERDGPHALVAGTTGSGKSELLQSLIAGLSASNTPDAVAFVLIDYKGGAAFADCARLPHCAGLVTDLDPHLTQRALQSLNAELRRRESLFAIAGAKDLDEYRCSPQHATQPLGRLVLVVDEFAALADELPDFVAGLIGIAQRGRSLGIHLVLATQRPGGVISPEIRANTTLRIALRVTDPAESFEVIGADDAASIDRHKPGRAYVRAGNTVTEIQTAQISAAAPLGDAKMRVVPLDEWGRAHPTDSTPDEGAKTDLALLVDALREVAARSAIPAPTPPWLPPLPPKLPLEEITSATPYRIPLGMVDEPEAQRQRPLLVDLRTAGPMSFVGGPRSGRTTALRTLAISSASRLTPDQLHIYAIDCAGGGLRSLDALAHCGAVTTRDDFATVDRLLARLAGEVTRRQVLLTDLGVSSLAETDDKPGLLPYLSLIIDGWEGFVAASEEYDAGRSVDVLLGLLRDSAAVGMTIAIAGDRATLAARPASSIARKFVLRLADHGDYTLAGLPTRVIPVAMPAGRAVCADTFHEVQFAFVGSDATTAEQTRGLAEVASTTPPAGPGRGPFAVRTLPRLVRLSSLGQAPSGHVLIGVGGDAAEPIAVDLFAADARLLVTGSVRSGRTTALRAILEQAIASDFEVRVAAPRRSPLSAAAAAHGIKVIWPDAEASSVQPVDGSPSVLLIDDTEAFLDTAVGDALTDLVRGRIGGFAAVAAARSDELAVTYRGVANEVRRCRSGLLLQPAPGDGDLLGVRLPRTRTSGIPGRGLLVLDQPQLAADGGLVSVQTALPDSPVPS